MFHKTLQEWEISGFQQYEGINNAMEHIGNEIEKERRVILCCFSHFHTSFIVSFGFTIIYRGIQSFSDFS